MPELRGLLKKKKPDAFAFKFGFFPKKHSFFSLEINFVLLRFRGCFLISESVSSCFVWALFSVFSIYLKIPKISPSKYKPPKLVMQKNHPLNRPSKYKPPGACPWKIALKFKVKQSQNGTFTSNYKASPIDIETQISLRR